MNPNQVCKEQYDPDSGGFESVPNLDVCHQTLLATAGSHSAWLFLACFTVLLNPLWTKTRPSPKIDVSV